MQINSYLQVKKFITFHPMIMSRHIFYLIVALHDIFKTNKRIEFDYAVVKVHNFHNPNSFITGIGYVKGVLCVQSLAVTLHTHSQLARPTDMFLLLAHSGCSGSHFAFFMHSAQAL